MLYDPTDPIQKAEARTRLNRLIEAGKRFEIKERRQLRTIKQNAYLHLILAYFAREYGETLEYVKTRFFKTQVNPSLFLKTHINPKTGKARKDLKSTSELTTRELAEAIDRFIDWSVSVAGIELPAPTDMESINNLRDELDRKN